MKKAVLSLSGGLDSTCLLLYLLDNNFFVKAYSFKYGQKHSIELEKVQKNIEFLRKEGYPVNHQIIDLTDCFNESASSLSSFSGVQIPEGHYESDNMMSTVVENRNVIFASILYGKALAWANKCQTDLSESDKRVKIYLGIHAGDHAIYPDCTPESREACEHAFRISNWNSQNVGYEAPFVLLTKQQVLQKGIESLQRMNFTDEEVQFVLSNTHTCYNPSETGKSCGKCGSCNERILSFAGLGMKDPIEYQNSWEEVLEYAKKTNK